MEPAAPERRSDLAVGLTRGLTGQTHLTVTAADTALALGSGDVPVLGTPRVLALAEAATVAALAGRLDPACTSVGARIELAHTAPSPIGAVVVAVATLQTVEGNRLEFEVSLRQDQQMVGQARIERVVVDRRRFLSHVAGAS